MTYPKPTTLAEAVTLAKGHVAAAIDMHKSTKAAEIAYAAIDRIREVAEIEMQEAYKRGCADVNTFNEGIAKPEELAEAAREARKWCADKMREWIPAIKAFENGVPANTREELKHFAFSVADSLERGPEAEG